MLITGNIHLERTNDGRFRFLERDDNNAVVWEKVFQPEQFYGAVRELTHPADTGARELSMKLEQPKADVSAPSAEGEIKKG